MRRISVLAMVLWGCVWFSANGQRPTSFPSFKEDSLFSQGLNEWRKLWIYEPDIKNTGQKLPVIYLLDGDMHMLNVAGIVQQLSSINGNTILPPMMIVAIPNTDRMRDLTPTPVRGGAGLDSNYVRTSGGGPRFQNFISRELKPFIHKKYSAAPYSIFIGHSLGGLLVLDTWLHQPSLFDAYLAIDPSLWWDDRRLLGDCMQQFKHLNFSTKPLYLAIANTLEPDQSVSAISADTSRSSFHLRSILLFDELLKSAKPDIKYASKYYPDDDHGSVPLIATYDGLRFMFNYYAFKISNATYRDSSAIIRDKLVDHFRQVSKEIGYTFLPPEHFVNQLAYIAWRNKQTEKARQLFLLNITNYPDSKQAYQAYQEFLLSQK